jgi:hypothetical protein
MDPTYKMAVTYAAGNTQEHPGLTEDRMLVGVEAFLRDMTNLEGRGVARLAIEIEGVEVEA